LHPNEVAAHLEACDLLVQPYPDGVSSRRGSAMAGLALGRPIVTTTGAATEPIWLDQGLVSADDAGDLPAFSARVESLLAYPEERWALGERAKTGYERSFSLGRCVATLRALV
jgi:glycosyltransferase involved in cell wall biosynthesis